MSQECVFCDIASGRLVTTLLYQDEEIVAFDDMNPQAPVHVVIIPRAHISSATELKEKHKDLIAHLVLAATRMARDKGIAETGYRLILNCGPDGRQEVPHLHLHLLGGTRLRGGMK